MLEPTETRVKSEEGKEKKKISEVQQEEKWGKEQCSKMSQ